MELNKLLSSVHNLIDYISATEDILKCTNIKIQMTMSAILNLKKVRSLEIEYFNKCEGNGVAFIVFEHMLKQPPSKTWRLLGKDLISMVQYWLEAVRKHLIMHNPRWWTFLSSLLRFILDIKGKDLSLVNTIVDQTTECLLDLACNSRLDELQRDQVLRCVNQCSAESSRELRIQMAERLSPYLVKLATVLSGCGHLPAQMSMLEVLLRWLVRRHDPGVRATAASAWFPSQLYTKETVDLFLNRLWRDFYQDARDFLNYHNGGATQRVTSLPCYKLTVGRATLFTGNSPNDCTWLDINVATRSFTSYIDFSGNRLDMLSITEDNVFSIELCREAGDTVLTVKTLVPPQLAYSEIDFEGDKCHLAAHIHFEDLPTLDGVIRNVFPGKYQGPVDLYTPALSLEKPKSGEPSASASRRNRSGYVVRSRNPLPWNSPSTASTTSLAQLRDKLTALPPLKYNKIPQKISATPELPVVREVSEYDEFGNSLSKNRRFGVAVKYQSDSEIKTATKKTRCISPVIKENSASLLLVATLGTNDESVINDTFDKLHKTNPEFDLLDLLVEEALQNGQDKDSGIISGKKTQESDVVENTPVEKVERQKKTTNRRAKSTVVGSTTDESEIDVIDDTPCYVFDRRKTYQHISKKPKDGVITENVITYDAEKVDAFFSQHMFENNAHGIAISPTLAKKINETSSEASDEPADNEVLDTEINGNLEDIVDCLNTIVDKVCSDLDKCADLMNEQQLDISRIVQQSNENTNELNINESKLKVDTKKGKNITLKFKSTKTRASKMNTKQKKSKPVKESNNFEEDKVSVENTDTNLLISPINTTKALITRKKRKLYSPKDDDNENNEIPRIKTESRQSNNNGTPIAMCYKELEKARKAQTRVTRKSRASTEPITSPKTKKLNDLFDKIKDKVVNDEKVTLVKTKRNKKDLSIYNMSSESEDEDFKKKKIQIQKRISSSSLESSATKRGRLVKPVNYSEQNGGSTSESEDKRAKRSKPVKQTKPRSRKVKIEPKINLIDERMREAKHEVLETSFVKETIDGHANEPEELVPALAQAPVMELIADNINDGIDVTEAVVPENTTSKSHKCKTVKIKKEKAINIKKEKGISKKNENVVTSLVTRKDKVSNKKDIVQNVPRKCDSASVSPLPGLVVETEQIRRDDLTASVEATLLQKFKNICTGVQDLSETDATQNMLLCMDNYNDDANLDVPENLETIEVSDVPSEKTIDTGGRSPITGHYDLDESPPNIELLEEDIQPRGLDIQEMNESLAEFLVNMRNQLNFQPIECPQNKTSPVLPFTKISTRERVMSIKSGASALKVDMNKLPSGEIELSTNPATPRSNVSNESNSKRPNVLTRLSSEEINTNQNPDSPRSNNSDSRVVLTRLSSAEIEKYLTSTKKSSTRSPTVIINRVSSDEINKWLPIPQFKCKDKVDEKSKKYNTRQTIKPTGVIKRTPEKVVEKKIKSIISPVKLNFDISDLRQTTERVKRICRSRSSVKSIKSHATDIKKDKEVITTSQTSSNTKIAESKKNSIKNLSQETVLKSSAETTDKLKKDKIQSADPSEVNANSSEMSKSIASVHEWFNRNVTASSPAKAENVAMKDILYKVMETLQTTLAEIHQSTGENISQVFLEYQKDINKVKEEVREVVEQLHRIQSNIEGIEKKQKERAYEVIRTDAEKKKMMVQLLTEDVQAIFDSIDKQ